MSRPVFGPRPAPRIGGAARGLAIASLAVAALLAGCTHGSGGSGTSGSGPAGVGRGGAVGSATAGADTTRAPAADTGTAGPAGGSSPGGPVVVSTVVGGVTTAVTVPPPADPLGAVPSHPVGAGDAAVASVMPGAYGLDSLGARVHGATIELAAQGGCAFALDVIRSGQWAVTPVLVPHGHVSVYLDVLTRGDRSALLTLTESSGLCTGRIVTETQQPLTLTGTISATGPARAVTVSCLAMVDDGAPPSHSIVVAYAAGGVALMAILTVPDAVGRHQVDPNDPAGVIVLHGHGSPLVQAAGVARAFVDPSAITPDATLPGVDEQHAWFQGTGATVTVTSADPLTGTLNAPHLGRESSGGSAAVSAGFSC